MQEYVEQAVGILLPLSSGGKFYLVSNLIGALNNIVRAKSDVHSHVPTVVDAPCGNKFR